LTDAPEGPAPELWLNLNLLDPGRVLDEARLAEDAGLTGILMGEHLLAPVMNGRSDYPYQARGWDERVQWLDPLVTFGVLATCTSRLRICTGVTIVPARDLLGLAKAICTVDFVAGGRLEFGAGIGWLREDYELGGKDFQGRGRALDTMLDQLRVLCAGGPVPVPVADGHPAIEATLTGPIPRRPIPFLIGGNSEAAFRRAGRMDGWIGVNVDLDALPAALAVMRGSYDGRGAPRCLVMAAGEPDAAPVREVLDRGATGVVVAARQFLQQLPDPADRARAYAGLAAEIERAVDVRSAKR
jgi:alkanesulfonate monooxygenase SsuD/methylene tetrahydromethanopterin reductase-like flavin-dependent oxidoreductase (luciferase family)